MFPRRELRVRVVDPGSPSASPPPGKPSSQESSRSAPPGNLSLSSAAALHPPPGPAAGSGSVGPDRVGSEPGGVRSVVPALSPPAGLSAVQQPAGSAPAAKLQRGIQVGDPEPALPPSGKYSILQESG